MRPLFVLTTLALLASALALPALGQETGTCPNGEPGTIVRNPATGEVIACVPDEPDFPPEDGEEEPPVLVNVTATDASGVEKGGDTITFRINRSERSADPLTVLFHLAGAAASGTDYQASATTSATIAANEISANVTVTPKADKANEPLENVTLVLDDSSAYDLGVPAKAHGNITNVPANTLGITVLSTDPDATEGGTGSGQTMTFAVSRSPADSTSHEQSFTLSVVGGSRASANDYSSTPAIGATMTIPDGAASFNLVVTAIDDTAREGLENLTLALDAGADYHVDAAKAKASGLINDNDVPSISVSAPDAAAAEATTPNPGRFAITRSGPSGTFSVPFALGGTATQGEYDVSPSGSTASFGANNVYEVTVTPRNDGAAEGSETIVLTVPASTAQPSDAAYYQIVTGSATVTVTDRDVPQVTVVANPTTGGEGISASPRLTLTRTDSDTTGLRLQDALRVDVQFGGTATFGTDYTVNNVNGTTIKNVTFLANKRSVNITVTVTNDAAPETTELLNFTVLPDPTFPIEWGVGSPDRVSVPLSDNDGIDTDGDGDLDGADNCPSLANADQANADGDTLGDACDPDDDADGLTDTEEATLGTDPKRADTDRDGRSDKQEKEDKTDPKDRFSPEYRAFDVQWNATGNGVRVTWRAPSGSLATRYVVFRASTPTFLANVSATSGTTSYGYTDSAYPGGEHAYFVQAMLPTETDTIYDEAVARGGPAKTIALCEAFTADQDGDGVCDRQELLDDTDPAKADTDGDGVDDGQDPTPLDAERKKVDILTEGPFWFGLLLLVAVLVVVAVVVRKGRRGPAAPFEEFEP